MKGVPLFASVFLIGPGMAPLPADSTQVDLRERVDKAARDGISTDELHALAGEAFAAADEATSRVTRMLRSIASSTRSRRCASSRTR